jgi:hypothetical protein
LYDYYNRNNVTWKEVVMQIRVSLNSYT